jgi:hypothetical protein
MQVDPQDLIKRCDIDLAQPLGADETDMAAADPIGARTSASVRQISNNPAIPFCLRASRNRTDGPKTDFEELCLLSRMGGVTYTRLP